jgi:hypothetical protein
MTKQNIAAWSRGDLYAIATWRKYIMWMIVIVVILTILTISLTAEVGESLALDVLRILRLIAPVFFIYMLAKSIRSKNMVWVYVVLSLLPIPLLSIVVMLFINYKATKILKENGVQVGLFGVKSSI